MDTKTKIVVTLVAIEACAYIVGFLVGYFIGRRHGQGDVVGFMQT